MGLTSAVIGGASTGCFINGNDCFGVNEFCPSQPGVLEIAECNEGWEFNDGDKTPSDEEAANKCLCRSLGCVDGRTADICVPGKRSSAFLPDNGDGTVTFSDGEARAFEEGTAICFGHANCTYEYIYCEEGRWYVDCVDGEGETVEYVEWDGVSFDHEDSARRYCAGEPFETAQYACRPIVVCEELDQAACEAESGCFYSTTYDECRGSALCGHGTETACNADPEREWS